MKIHDYMLAITVALFVSMPSYAAEVPSDLGTGDSADLEVFNSEEFESESSSSEESESESDDGLADLDEPVSESDIGDSVDVSNSEPDVVDVPVYFDDSVNFNNDEDEAQLLATPIPAAIWLFATGLLGLNSIVKRYKKT